MGKEFVDYVNLYGKEMKKPKGIKIKLHLLLGLYEEIDKLKERLDVLEKKLSND